MAATKSKSGSGSKKGSDGKSSGRCWPGYEPTPGKRPGAKGSCKKKGS